MKKEICYNNIMGKIVYITKRLFGKINWDEVKSHLLNILKKKFTIKESGSTIKIDRKFVEEFIHSKYSVNANTKIKKVSPPQ